MAVVGNPHPLIQIVRGAALPLFGLILIAALDRQATSDQVQQARLADAGS